MVSRTFFLSVSFTTIADTSLRGKLVRACDVWSQTRKAMRPWSSGGERGTRLHLRIFRCSPPTPLPSSHVLVSFRMTLCRPWGAQRCCGNWFLGPVFHLNLASLPLLASACTSHLGARPCVTVASPRSVLGLGVLSTPCVLCLLLVSPSLCCIFCLTFIVCISA